MAEEEKKNETKEENAFSKMWKKAKQSVNDTVLEAKIRSAFEKEHEIFTVYTKNELLPKSVYGSITDGVLTVFDKVDVKAWSVIVANEDDKAYYVMSTTAATVTAEVEGVSYERPGTAIYLDENVEEVNVVKAGKRYYLYKGPNKG